MDLTSDRPFWLLQDGLIASYPPLERNVRCEVAIIGAGITGALLAHRLVEAGMETVVIDRRDVGAGSTCASTALVQYEIDVHLVDLAKMVGEQPAKRAYQLCYAAIDRLADWVGKLPDRCGFSRKQSLYVASHANDAQPLAEECSARERCGIPVSFLGQVELAERFQLDAPAALTSPQAAQVDAYRLTHGLLQYGQARGLRVYDRTEVEKFEHVAAGLRLHTNRECSISARKVIFAAGYEAHCELPRPIVNLKSTYALATQPRAVLRGWPLDHVMWESSRPYCYLRTTDDGRVLFGGEDDDFRNPARRDASLPMKSERLIARCRRLLRDDSLDVDYSWAGTFGETRDGLPYIDSTPSFPNTYFVLGFGGNGTTFSVLAAEMMPELIRNGAHPDQRLFRFDR